MEYENKEVKEERGRGRRGREDLSHSVIFEEKCYRKSMELDIWVCSNFVFLIEVTNIW